MSNGGNIVINLDLNSANFNRNWNSAMNTVERGQRQINNASSSMTAGFGKLGKAVTAAFSVKVITDFAKSCISLGSDLAEIQNVVDVTFKNSAGAINKWSKEAMTAYGLSEKAAKQYTGVMGSMLKSSGISNDMLVEMSTTLAGLAGDMASFNNLSTDEAFAKIRAGILGETEPLKSLGYNLSVANLETFALTQGITKSYKEMGQAEQVMLRYKYLMQQTADVQGDWARTSDSWSNQVKLLQLQWDSFKSSLGQGFIQALTPVLQGLNELMGYLQGVADGFNQITAAIFGVQEAAAGGGTTEIATDMAEVADSATAAQKATSRMTTSFDELNKIGSSSSSAGGGSSSSITTTSSDSGDPEENVNKWTEAIDNLKNTMRPFLEEFKSGFNEVFDITRLENIKDNISDIGESLSDIFTHDWTQEAIKDFGSAFSKSIGQQSGAFLSIGTTIGDLVTGSLDDYLEGNKGFLFDRVWGMFGTAEEIATQAGNYSAAVADVFEVFSSPDAKLIGSHVTEFFVNPLLSAIDTLGMFSSDLYNLVTQPFINNSEEIKRVLADLLEPIENWARSLSDFATEAGTALTESYEKHFGPFMDDLTTGISELVASFTSMWTEHFQPVIDALASKFSELMENSIKPAFEKFTGFVNTLIDAIKDLWNDLLKPLVDWFVTYLLPMIAPVIEKIGTMFMETVGVMIDLIGDLFTVLSGVIDFVVGVFTGDWEQAWEGIKNIFKGVWDSFVDIVKTPLNLIIDMINGLIEKINAAIQIEIPDWVPGSGGESWGVNIPTIPRLAKGAALYKPTFFQGGEYPGAGTNPEIVAPQSAMAEAVATGLKMAGFTTNNNTTGEIHIHNYLYPGAEEFSETIYQANELYRFRMS